MSWEIRQGDALDRLREMPGEAVHCCVTSPPYWGLRDYGVEGQVGLEPSPAAFVERMVAILEEVRRVLRADGTLWLNLGDSYARWAGFDDPHRQGRPGGAKGVGPRTQPNRLPIQGLKPKDLVGIPWRVAFALQAAGWYLRSDIIWSKPNPLPESITDRPTKAHEYIFLLTKSRRYFYDQEATRAPDSGQDHARTVLEGQPSLEPSNGLAAPHAGLQTPNGRDGRGRNLRSVWSVATRAYPGAHFATFPPKLIEPCIRAGAAEQVCSECGAPWRRLVEVDYENPGNRTSNGPRSIERKGEEYGTAGFAQRLERRSRTTGFEPTCEHAEGGGSAVVLDPFAGASTTGVVATRLDRSYIGIELNPDYVELGRRRIIDDAPLLNSGIEVAA